MKIGLTYTGSPEKHQFYVDWLSQEGDAEIIRLSADLDNLQEVQSCDGIVLSGGKDIHPSWYGTESSDYPGAPESFDRPRDAFEIAVFNKALQQQIPVLGICRGMQLINVACHGTLLQDLGDQKLKKVHQGNPDKLHEVKVEAGSLLCDIVGNREGSINSAHHQAIEKTGNGLFASAYSGEGVVEGLEWKDKKGKPFLLGVQWHPERMFRFGLENTPFSRNIRERFAGEIRNNNS